MSAERREEETMNESKVPREAAVAMVGEGAADALVREATVGIGLCPEAGVVAAWGRAALLVIPTKSRDFAPVSSAVAHTATNADRGELRGRTTVEALREWCGPVEVPACGCVPCPFCTGKFCEPCEDEKRLTWRAGSESARKRVRPCRDCAGTGERARLSADATLYGHPIDTALLGAWLAAAPMLTGPVEVWCNPEAAGGHDCQNGALFTLVCEGGRLVIAGLRADMLGTRSFTDGATGGA